MTTLSKGAYLIGDPCYIIRGETWDKMLHETDCFRSNSDGKYTVADADGTKHDIVVFGTGGDGGHGGSDGFEYGVDSGSLAAIPCSFKIDASLIGVLHLGLKWCKVYQSSKDFKCQNLCGELKFGDLYIRKIWG